MIKKILIGIGIFILVIVLAGVVTISLITSTDKPKGNKQEILTSSTQSFKKALIVYQPSLSDIVTKMAHQIAKGLNDGGYEVTLNYPGAHLPTNISDYSLVIFGTPTYAGRPLSIMTDYMSKIKDYSSSKVVLFSTGANTQAMELDEMEKSLKGTKPYKKVKFISGKKENENNAYKLGMELSKE